MPYEARGCLTAGSGCACVTMQSGDAGGDGDTTTPGGRSRNHIRAENVNPGIQVAHSSQRRPQMSA
jgi:hypothetical protein